jgi:hypothetical protein
MANNMKAVLGFLVDQCKLWALMQKQNKLLDFHNRILIELLILQYWIRSILWKIIRVLLLFINSFAFAGNAELYSKVGVPFVIGTTGGDRDLLYKTVEDSKNYAVISPQMGKQVNHNSGNLEKFSICHVYSCILSSLCCYTFSFRLLLFLQLWKLWQSNFLEPFLGIPYRYLFCCIYILLLWEGFVRNIIILAHPLNCLYYFLGKIVLKV